MGSTGRTRYSSVGENETVGGEHCRDKWKKERIAMESVGDDERRRVSKFPGCRQRGEQFRHWALNSCPEMGSPAAVWALFSISMMSKCGCDSKILRLSI